MSVANIRKSYDKDELLEANASDNPFEQLNFWLGHALAEGVPDATAMVLSTVNEAHRPSSRVVLLKGVEDDGLVFYTNYNSRKAHELASNPWGSLLFFWQFLERQIRIEGRITKVSAETSDAYYHSRPLGSRLGAWASQQSEPTTIEALQARVEAVTQQYGDNPPRPPHWGGYHLAPTHFEFWQGRPSRLHDRLAYDLTEDGTWSRTRLAP